MRFLSIAVLMAASALTAQSPLTTTFANNNANANGGMCFFDLDVTSAAGIQITSVDIHTGALAGGIEFWTCPTAWLGNEANAGAWTSQGIGTFSTGAGTGVGTQVCFGNGFYLPQGQYGVAIQQDSATNALYTTAVGFPLVYTVNEVTLTAGASNNAPFAGAPFNPRLWNGSIYFNVGPVPGTCIANAQSESYGLGCNRSYASVHTGVTSATPYVGSKLSYTATMPGQLLIIDTASGSGFEPVGTLAAATAAVLTDDSQSPVGTLGVTVGSNGWVAFGAGNSNSYIPAEATMLANPAEGFYFWRDMNPSAAGSGQVMYEEAGTDWMVTYDGVFDFGGTTPDNYIQVRGNTATGMVEVRIDAMSAQNTLFGYSPAGVNADPGPTDLLTVAGGVLVLGGTDTIPLTLDGGNGPQLGATWDLTTSEIDAVSPFAITFFGDRGPATPMTLIGINAPGCDINLASTITNTTAVQSGGSATSSVPIPNNVALAGFQFSAQSICLTLTNSAGLLTSNGAEGTVGQ